MREIIDGGPMMAQPPAPEKVQGTRIQIARMRRSLQVWQVADAAGISRHRMWAIERRGARPTDDELQSIADVTKFPIGFFFRPAIDMKALREAFK